MAFVFQWVVEEARKKKLRSSSVIGAATEPRQTTPLERAPVGDRRKEVRYEFAMRITVDITWNAAWKSPYPKIDIVVSTGVKHTGV
jgi:hypothetical protein